MPERRASAGGVTAKPDERDRFEVAVERSSASNSAMRSTSSVSTTRVTRRSPRRSRSRSLFRSRAKPTSARR